MFAPQYFHWGANAPPPPPRIDASGPGSMARSALEALGRIGALSCYLSLFFAFSYKMDFQKHQILGGARAPAAPPPSPRKSTTHFNSSADIQILYPLLNIL